MKKFKTTTKTYKNGTQIYDDVLLSEDMTLNQNGLNIKTKSKLVQIKEIVLTYVL
ncbi:MAG: hypothetical protein PUD59_04790 [bacterium]|nr:hypothetical protein [bacterium]